MDTPDHLIAHLAELTDLLDEPGTDLQAVLAVLVDDLMTAVPSFLGLTISIPTAGTEVTVNLLDPHLADAVTSSLLLPLAALGIAGTGGTGGTGGTIVFYAAQPGAFVDLAADTRFAFGLDGQVALDQHLPSMDGPVASSGMSGHIEASTINRALGVLLDRGHTPQAARSVLQRRADRDGVPLHHVARQLLDGPADEPWPTH